VADKWGGVLPELKKYAEERQKLVDQKEQKDASVAAADEQWTNLRKTIEHVRTAVEDARSFRRSFRCRPSVRHGEDPEIIQGR
jgi:phage shock protein A